MRSDAPNYRGYRFPPEIISYAVWLYHRFCLSFRDIEDLLAQRGITVSYEAIPKCHTNPLVSASDKCDGSSLLDRRNDFSRVHGVIQNLFRVGRHLLRAANHRELRTRAFLVWHAATCA